MYLAGSESPRYLPPNASVFERGRARRARQRHPRKVRLTYDEPRHRHLPVWRPESPPSSQAHTEIDPNRSISSTSETTTYMQED